MSVNGTGKDHGLQNMQPTTRADETEKILTAVKDLVVDFVRTADNNATLAAKASDHDSAATNGHTMPTLLDYQNPSELSNLLDFRLQDAGRGLEGVVDLARRIQKHSVNTWDQGFLDKLYHSPTPIGVAADLLLSSLNTNVHIYQVAPALTLIEKRTTRALASMFGFHGQFAGGFSQPGGSAANQTSLVIARNTLFPETKREGNGARRFVLFTSAHGHYSVEKAAQISGFGSNAVRSIPVDSQGRMRPDALEAAIEKCRSEGETPFYVNATAGTTVLGSYDPLDEIAEVCKRQGLWLHVDGSWGGSVVFSARQRWKLKGVERADSMSICAHKMLGVPLTCSFLLGRDLRLFHRAMTLPAGYLFHGDGEAGEETASYGGLDDGVFWDLADLTPQCGRRGDTLKFALSWIYYGTEGYAAYVGHAFEMAEYLASLVKSHARFSLVSEDPPPCLQVCFYFDKQSGEGAKERNSKITERGKDALLAKGLMIDYAPGEEGKFFRVVVNGQTQRETCVRLINAIEDVGSDVHV